MKDILGILGFLAVVVLGALFINTFLFRSFDVTGPSMQDTLQSGDRVIVSRLHYTKSLFTSDPYVPERGQIIVFRNPQFEAGQFDKFIVKRVIAFPGERVVVQDGELIVHTKSPTLGIIRPDEEYPGIRTPTSGMVDMVVPEGELFVAGDNRQNGFSLDSRNGLGTVPFNLVQGPVVLRIFPFDQITRF